MNGQFQNRNGNARTDAVRPPNATYLWAILWFLLCGHLDIQLAQAAPPENSGTPTAREQATEQYWREAVYEIHRLRLDPPVDPAARADEVFPKLLETTKAATEAAMQLDTRDVDPDLVTMARAHLKIDQRTSQLLNEVFALLKEAGHPVRDERTVLQMIEQTPQDVERFLTLDLTNAPIRLQTLQANFREQIEVRAEADLGARMMQARLVERYPGIEFPLPKVEMDQFAPNLMISVAPERASLSEFEHRKTGRTTARFWCNTVLPLERLLNDEATTPKQLLVAIAEIESLDEENVDKQLTAMVNVHLKVVGEICDFADLMQWLARPASLSERLNRPIVDAFKEAQQLSEQEENKSQTGQEPTRIEQLSQRQQDLADAWEIALWETRIMSARLEERYPGSQFPVPESVEGGQ